MVTHRAAVVGASGYSGAELCALLARHRGIRLEALMSGPSGEGGPFGSIHPALHGREGPDVEPFDLERLLGLGPDSVFLATPDETAASIAGPLLDAGARVIDLSGAHRLTRAEEYPRWYGFTHPRPELLDEAVYGLTEWCDGSLPGARLVANPGCYPTSILLALKPIVHRLDPDQPVVCDASSGASGAGRRSETAYSFVEVAGNFKTYGVGRHRHEPEMRARLGLADRTPFVFVAHLLPAPRGLLATIHVAFAAPTGPEELQRDYAEAYRSSPFVTLRPPGTLPEIKEVVGTPRAAIGFVLLAGGRRAVVVSVVDNLLKGAASQAVQNLNRALGFDEREGLA